MAASDLLGVGECSSTLKPYVSPTAAATTIQMAYRCYIARWITQQRASRPHYNHRVTQVLDAMPPLPAAVTALEAKFDAIFSNFHTTFLSGFTASLMQLESAMTTAVTPPWWKLLPLVRHVE